MVLASLDEVTIGFRGPSLLDGVTCRIEDQQRIGLLGRNGSGKTTLMRMLAGEVEPDAGQVHLAPTTRVAWLPQDVPRNMHGDVESLVRSGLQGQDHDAADSWQLEHFVERTLNEMQLDGAAEFSSLSSGLKRRVLLARALVGRPNLLLLDEPTNHLDIDSIQWLEQFLGRWDGALLFVTHDRMFLRRLATRILEIDRGRLFDWACDYDTFLRRKEATLAEEEKQNALRDKKLAEEERWIRQGIKARRTRNEGRVRALQKLRRERADRRERVGVARMKIQEALRSGALVAEVDEVSFSYGDLPILRGFSTLIQRGDKIGVIGPNGAGKTTLLRILLGQLAPDQGAVRLGTRLAVAYFDQLREQLDPRKTVAENVGDGYDTVECRGTRRHLLGYLQDFLFTPERARTPVQQLSGGERHRVLLAKLFAKPANVLVLDEPTNDLDAETLELLEQLLVEFSGTVLVVSHDREFLNRVATSTVVFERQGVKEYVGGYDDWLRQSTDAPSPSAAAAARPTRSKSNTKPAAGSSENRKLTYREQQELEKLPGEIEQLEQQVAELHQAMGDPEFYRRGGDEIAAAQRQLESLNQQTAAAYQRWEELDARQ